MHRRKLIQLLSASTVVTSVGVGFASPVTAANNQTVDWEYKGEKGFEHWAELSPEFQACQQGTEQSPIDLQQATQTDPTTLKFNYSSSPLKVVHNGHTIQVNCAPENTLVLDGKTFNLLQFHFHHPSEHWLTGQPFPMELHLVHRSETGELAVLGIFLQQGQANSALQPIWEAMPTQAGPEKVVPGVRVDLAKLLPSDRKFERYRGSLTTPPCSEGVTWLVMEQPLEVSAAQIQQFTQVIGLNARPVQALNRRSLLRSS